jgi:hypothetical protein
MKNLLIYLAKNILLKNFTTYRNVEISDKILSVSDFFPYRNDLLTTNYVLENTFAMYSCSQSNFIVEFVFFDRNGVFCFKKTVKFNGFDISIDFSEFKNSLDSFGGFFVNLKASNKKFTFIPKFRGYTGFSLPFENFTSYVHGNFGALYKTPSNHFKSLVKISNKSFYYTPQVILNNRQEFFFLNPYEIDLRVNCYQNLNGQLKLIDQKIVKPFGAWIFKPKLKKSKDLFIPTFESKSPSLRAVIFEKCPNGSYDILHS